MKKNQFYSLLSVCILLIASCTPNEKKAEAVKKDSLINTTLSSKKRLKTDTIATVFKATCGQVVGEILTTSDSYKNLTDGLEERVIKNGGTSFGFMCEGSPNPKIDSAMNYSETYDYSVHESYPDHSPVIARYTFDPVKKQLFEYNTASDSLIPISFNKSLLLDLDKVCSKN